MLGEKALDCLELASMPIASPERMARYWLLAGIYSEKAVIAKLEQLAAKGLIEYGVAASYGWLTDAGRTALGARVRDFAE